ncbi:hypothetical protein [uncultured Shewanella sp.]|uniref:VirB4 family type IV secretion/conjugal transfer ATPase n=1 Tax=uncultured Shewanella sp. TaxID=173975 RepID=UPI002614D143|nr:hypothetical protein [uncultured Shewanella sp.]
MSANGLKTIELINQLPKYGYPINHQMISLDDSKLMATVCLNGMPFESESTAVLEQAFLLVKGFFNQLSKLHGSKLALWTHIIKRKDKLQAQYQFDDPFMSSFSKKYLESFEGQRFFKTDYYLTFVLKYDNLLDGEADMEELLKQSVSALKRFDCSVLSFNDETRRVEPAEFLSYLMNGKVQPIPITSNKVVNVINNSDWHFGYDLSEIRHANSQTSRYATFFEISGYPSTTKLGMWDFILKQQCEFVLTQSIVLMKSHAAMKLIDKQINLISSGSDSADHEIEELQAARDYVATSEISFGDYHASLAVFGDTPKRVMDDSSDLDGEFMARDTMLKRSNLKSLFSFLSMLPASNKRVMPSPRTTTNLACGWSLHNYSRGKEKGNPIGDGSAIIPLKTASDGLFHFNCHASDSNKDVTGQKLAGHTLLTGASGTGKTTLSAVITGFFTRFNPQIFCIDYNRSTELYMRAFGGEYFVVREGVDTGLNPFQLDDTPTLRSFLNNLVCRIGADEKGLITADDELIIKNAINALMVNELHQRGISTLLQSIPPSDLKIRLSKWSRDDGGKFGWCLDSPINTFNPSIMDRVGFDATMLLEVDGSGKAHPASEAILGVLFFLKDLMQQEGRLMMTMVEEFWMPANFPLTQVQMKRILKAGRLKNEFMVLGSQSPEDAINCEIFPAIVQQTATKIFLPNPDAEYDAYQRCNLTKGEFDKVKALDKASRTFLIKQSNVSCLAKLDLFGFDEFLPIISGSDDVIYACEKIRAEYGNNPDVWIPKLQALIKDGAI